MATNPQADKAAQLRRLHHRPQTLVLLNTADVGSSKIVEQAGFPAVATSSAGIAWLLGYADGEQISRREMLAMVRRIASAVAVPVSADIEGGYGDLPEDVAETVRQTLAAGAVGINLEDSGRRAGELLLDATLAAERLRAARQAAEKSAIPLLINARTDCYLRRPHDAASFAETVRRGNAYLEAGADCVFVPGVVDAEIIGALVGEIGGPLNILAKATAPPVAEMQALGVARLSVGGLVSLAAMTLFRSAAAELSGPGTYGFAHDILLHGEANELLGH